MRASQTPLLLVAAAFAFQCERLLATPTSEPLPKPATERVWPKADPVAPITIPSRFKTAGTAGNAHIVSGSGGSSGSWWRIFRDDTLDKLERDAIAANQDLRQAVGRVEEARAQSRAVAAAFFPTVTAPLRATRERTTNTGPIISSQLVGEGMFPAAPGAAASGAPVAFAGQALSASINDLQAQLQVSYEVDVFGRIRHAYGQSRALAQASAADRQAVELGLSSQVAAGYFSLRALDSKVAVLKRAVKLRADALQIQQQRVKAGAGSDVDRLRAQVEAANTEADLAEAVQQRAELENSLAVLCGQPASDFHLPPHPLEQTPPPAIPATIPAQMLTQRPDLIESERRMAAASEGVKAARAQFYPTFNVLANYGYGSAQSSQLLEDQSHIWSITGAISIPIFQGGRNKADLKAAHARTEQSLAAYRQTALTAFREAENALSALRQRELQAGAREKATEGARRVFQASQQSYLEGGTIYFEVIDAQRVLLNAELAQVQTLNTRYAATIDLIKAMGGTFESGQGPKISSKM